MRVLYLSADPGVPVFGAKGASVHLRAMAAALHRLGHEVLIASPRVEDGENSLPAGVSSKSIPAVLPRTSDAPDEVLGQIEQQAQAVLALARGARIDGVYERYSLTSVAGARTATELSVPLALEVNAPLRDEARRFRDLAHEPLALQTERETFAAAERLFVVSPALERWLGESGVEPARVEVMRNAPPDRAFVHRHPIPERSPVIVGFSGGLKLWHGIETLVRGFELAVHRGARMRLEVLGKGPAEALLDGTSLPDELLRRWGHLPHDDALSMLERWDVGIAAYSDVPDFYFSPLKLFEYMAAGLCPLATDVGELAAIVDHGRAGVVIPPDDADALADALLALDRDRALIRELGSRAQAAARRMPSWSENARRVVASLSREPSAAGITAEESA